MASEDEQQTAHSFHIDIMPLLTYTSSQLLFTLAFMYMLSKWLSRLSLQLQDLPRREFGGWRLLHRCPYRMLGRTRRKCRRR